MGEEFNLHIRAWAMAVAWEQQAGQGGTLPELAMGKVPANSKEEYAITSTTYRP